MRAYAMLAILAATLAAPALADGAGLTLSDLTLSFDPEAQASVFSFNLTNDAHGAAQGLFATVTIFQHMFPESGVPVGPGLAANGTGHYDVRVVDRPIVNGCIFVFTTAKNQTKVSNEGCATISAVIAPAAPAAPSPPAVPTAPSVPDVPPPTVPDVPPTPDAPAVPSP